jgi:hypothetical protein
MPLHRHRLMLLLGLAVCMAVGGGCVQRRMIVRSNPPGALLYVDDKEIGMTPCATSFTYYGKRKFRLVKDGYETLTEMRWIPPPWYEFPPLDFVSENFVPGQIRDNRVVDFQLSPQAVVPSEQLLSRAEELRSGSHAAAAASGGNTPPSGTGVVPPGAHPQPEPIPAPPGVGGQSVHPLPPR